MNHRSGWSISELVFLHPHPFVSLEHIDRGVWVWEAVYETLRYSLGSCILSNSLY